MNIKGMDANMQCRGFQFEIGKEYKKENNGKPLKLCSDTVFHYCKSLLQVHNYYNCFDECNRYFEIEVLGEEVSDGEKCGSDHIKILREITGNELEALKGLVNGNAGLFNTGNYNAGYHNTGDYNTGYHNAGNYNVGHYNTGDYNTGYHNAGDYNVGHYNTGDYNVGHYNTGDYNTGDFNKCNNSNGVFCNEEDTNIRIFNKPSGMSMEDFYRSRYWAALTESRIPLIEWIEYTAEEMVADPKKGFLGGYLKTNNYKEACAKWWDSLSDNAKQTIQEIPNFDAEVFKDITGIEV